MLLGFMMMFDQQKEFDSFTFSWGIELGRRENGENCLSEWDNTRDHANVWGHNEYISQVRILHQSLSSSLTHSSHLRLNSTFSYSLFRDQHFPNQQYEVLRPRRPRHRHWCSRQPSSWHQAPQGSQAS